MKHKLSGIYGKVFFYTLLILFFIVCVTGIFFASQIKEVMEATQRRQFIDVFQPFIQQLSGKSNEEIIESARDFKEKNTFFEFCLETEDGEVLYQTDDFTQLQSNGGLREENDLLSRNGTLKEGRKLITNISGKYIQISLPVLDNVKLYIKGSLSETEIYSEFMGKMIIALVLILIISIFAAAVFARKITTPIRKIAKDTKRMADLEFVPAPVARRDEIGQLAGDVYKMYETLKMTIRQLETEIEHEKEMEENQRYFFSAASHELKTPIAATSALLEGMLANLVDVSEYPGYMRECLKMMTEQNKLISEILEVISLGSDSIKQEEEVTGLYTLVSEVLPAYRTIMNAKAQTLETDIPDNLLCTVDTKLFRKVLSNILMNAVQNTPEKGRIKIYTEETEEDSTRLCILNSGAKIDEEIIPKLFQPFYREDKARSRSQGRSGMGLTIVQKALDRMGIHFSLENTEEGVLFWMNVPY